METECSNHFYVSNSKIINYPTSTNESIELANPSFDDSVDSFMYSGKINTNDGYAGSIFLKTALGDSD